MSLLFSLMSDRSRYFSLFPTLNRRFLAFYRDDSFLKQPRSNFSSEERKKGFHRPPMFIAEIKSQLLREKKQEEK